MNNKKYYILYHKLRNTDSNFIYVYKNIFYNKKRSMFMPLPSPKYPHPTPIPYGDRHRRSI